jgi:hypothetical protein
VSEYQDLVAGLDRAQHFAEAMHTALSTLTDHGLTRFSFSQRPANVSGYRRQRRRHGYAKWPSRRRR